MNDPSDRDRLLVDIFCEEQTLRTASLVRGLTEFRRGRRRRKARTVCVMGVVILAALLLVTGRHRPALVPAARVAPARPLPVSTLKILTDDELLAQFPGRAVALVGSPRRQRLVFLDVDNPAQREVR